MVFRPKIAIHLRCVDLNLSSLWWEGPSFHSFGRENSCAAKLTELETY
jgi:hypothetical protein